jgi:sirohydrochlorin cobaltochelatase
MTALPEPQPALLLAAHGTTDQAGVDAFAALAGRVAKLAAAAAAGGMRVAGGFIELSAPALRDAVSSLVNGHPTAMVAVPLMLSAAGHAKGDIPAALARERERRPGLSYAYGRPLGPHPALLRLLEERLDAVLEPAERADTAVLLVGRGSTDPDANAEIHKVARLLWEGRGPAMVEPAFVSLARPGVPEGLERCRRLGAARIVVLPYFLFSGVLPDRVVAEAKAYEGAEVRCADVIGDCDGLADLVIERYEEALRGDIRMNCDTCVYRLAMPGFEDRVGAPQRPHHHPDDPSHVHAH